MPAYEGAPATELPVLLDQLGLPLPHRRGHLATDRFGPLQEAQGAVLRSGGASRYPARSAYFRPLQLQRQIRYLYRPRHRSRGGLDTAGPEKPLGGLAALTAHGSAAALASMAG